MAFFLNGERRVIKKTIILSTYFHASSHLKQSFNFLAWLKKQQQYNNI